jgi:hypothetical protein
MKKLILIALAFTFVLSACKKKEEDEETPEPVTPTGTVEVIVEPVYQGNPVTLPYRLLTEGGDSMLITEMKYFISDIGLSKENAQEVPALALEGETEQYGIFLVNHGASNATAADGSSPAYRFRFKAETGSYSDIRFNVGVPREYNLADITTNPYPVNGSNGMYWSWNSGFKFFVINGKFGTDAAIADKALHMSIGVNSRIMAYNFRSMLLAPSLPKIEVTEGKTTTIRLSYDIATLLTNTDGSDYRLVAPGTGSTAPNPCQVHGGYYSDILKANAGSAMELIDFETK